MKNIFEDKLVSIIIPIYNCENYIKYALDSVLMQTYKGKIEILVIDDASHDNSANIVMDYMKKYPNIFYYKNEKNIGVGASRNIVIKKARGRFIALLDADDIWRKDKLEKQIDFMCENKLAFSYTAIEMIDKYGKLFKKKRNIKTDVTYKFLLKNTMIANSSVIIDRYIINDFLMSERRLSPDYSTWLRLLRNNYIAKGINEAMLSYRVYSGSLSSNKLKSIKYIWDVQTQDEHLNPFYVAFNIIFWSFNSFKKYFL